MIGRTPNMKTKAEKEIYPQKEKKSQWNDITEVDTGHFWLKCFFEERILIYLINEDGEPSERQHISYTTVKFFV